MKAVASGYKQGLEMQNHWFRVVLIVGACLALQAARKDFWETKDSSGWSDGEKQVLLSQSPWAKQGLARMEVEKKERKGPGYGTDGRPDTGPPDVRPGATPGGRRSVPIGEEVPPVPSADPGPSVQFPVLARWETAKPIRLAGGPELPEVPGQFYVIRLRGLPLMRPPKAKPGEVVPNPNQGMLEAIKEGSRLERKDKPAIPCARLFAGSGDNSNEVILFFPRIGGDEITVADKLVTLEIRFAPFHLSVRFPLKDMLYKGELSL
jgi:hypothetical protein